MVNVYVNGEWIFSGEYEQAMEVADRYYFDDETWFDVEITSDDDTDNL